MMVNLQSDMYTEFDKDPQPITAFVAWLAGTYHLPHQLNVLDMGCGPGRMLAEYHRLGWHVTGMEPDPDFYQSALSHTKHIRGAHVYNGGFLEMNFEDSFHLITAVNNPFSYLLDVADRLQALDNIYRALKPGGVFFLELTNFLYKLQHFEPVTVQHKAVDGENVFHIMENRIDFDQARWLIRDQYVIEGEADILEKQHEQAVITPPELLYFLEERGFVDIRTYNSYCARFSTPVNGKTILVSAQKPMSAS
jgi:SAM-dependent methyltransferase